ncbi:MAG: sodium/glucose cotransporter 2, partial [Bacteroidota bacterium]
RNIQHARWGVILAGFLKVIPLFIMVIPGAMAISLFPGLENADAVFPTIVVEVLPAGLIGLVLAGLISAIMSSVDSTLNSASTLLVVDFVKPRNPGITPERTAYYGRMSTLILMIVAAVWAPMIANFGGLWAYLQQMFAIVVPPIAAIFLLGVFYKRGNGEGAFWTLVIGTVLGTIIFLLGQFDMWDIHFTINVGIMLAVSSIIFIAVSNRTEAPPAEKIEDYTFKKSLISEGMEGMPWYKDYRFHMVLLLGLILYILIAFF